MIEKVIKKYGKILEQENNIFRLKLNVSFEEFKNKVEKELSDYTVELISKKGDNVKVRFNKDLFKIFQDEIKKYKEGVLPEDLKYSED